MRTRIESRRINGRLEHQGAAGPVRRQMVAILRALLTADPHIPSPVDQKPAGEDKHTVGGSPAPMLTPGRRIRPSSCRPGGFCRSSTKVPLTEVGREYLVHIDVDTVD